jgi:F420-dependent oxidoreductase-like protein
MKLGLNLGYWQRHADDATESVLAAERLGYDSVWTAEAYGSDVFTPLAWYGARTSRIKLGTSIAQMSARPPVTTAMTAMTIDHLTGGRLLLGVGASGPQVVEGWYGQPFAKPLARTREYVEIMRKVWRREEPVTSDGPHYPLPLADSLGKPLKLITHPLRSDIPVYLGAEGPKNVALAAELAQGWLPLFAFPSKIEEMYGEALAGAPEDFDVAAMVMVVISRCTSAAWGSSTATSMPTSSAGWAMPRRQNTSNRCTSPAGRMRLSGRSRTNWPMASRSWARPGGSRSASKSGARAPSRASWSWARATSPR